MCKGFDKRDMLLKHIPYISLTCPVDLTHKYPLSFSTTEETEMRKSVKMVMICVPLAIFSMREYVILLVKLWQFALETMAVSGKKCLKR